jgi:hypothetical protein
MPISIGGGIRIGGGITIDGGAAGSGDPNLDNGTTVAWSDGTIFDTWTSSSSSTTDGTNNVTTIWQMFYAHVAIKIVSGTSGARIGTHTSGTNSWQWALSLSGTNNTQSNFGSASTITTTTSNSYTSGGTYIRVYNANISIPANRYFIIGRTAGPFYYSSRTLNANRTATIGGIPQFTVINKIWKGSTSTTFTIPSQLGGSATYTEVSNISQVAGFRFDLQ